MSERVDVPVAFAPTKVAVAQDGSMRLSIATDGGRAGVNLAARLHRPGVARDALLAIGDVLGSDLRRKASDRADYLQYLIARGKGVSKAVWDAQKEYLALQYSVAAKQDEPLDPALTVARDALRFEVMSRDESTYAQLVFQRPASLVDADNPADAGRAYGTTFVDLGPEAIAAIGRIRAYRSTTVAFASTTAPTTTRTVPLRWLRAFGQMQAASLLAPEVGTDGAGARFELSPVDLYNVLLALRLRKARTPPRGLRYELVPGERPRLVLEPWDLVVHGTGGVYRGSQPRVIRTWGRNRLAVLARVLPHAKKVDVVISGPGLPAVYVVDLGDATFSLALSGWTDAGWAGISTFDLLAADDDPQNIDAITGVLGEPMNLGALAAKVGRPRGEVRRTLLAALAQLRVGYDLATSTFYPRSLLLSQPLPPGALKFRDPREAAAHRLLAEPGSVTLTKVADQPEGRAIEGQVVDAKLGRIARSIRRSRSICARVPNVVGVVHVLGVPSRRDQRRPMRAHDRIARAARARAGAPRGRSRDARRPRADHRRDARVHAANAGGRRDVSRVARRPRRRRAVWTRDDTAHAEAALRHHRCCACRVFCATRGSLDERLSRCDPGMTCSWEFMFRRRSRFR